MNLHLRRGAVCVTAGLLLCGLSFAPTVLEARAADEANVTGAATAVDNTAPSAYRQALNKEATTSLLVLDPDEKVWALQVTSGSKLSVLKGDAVVNSSHQKALWITDGTVDVPNGDIGVVGGVHLSGEPTVTPEPITGLKAHDDPFPAIAVPDDLPVISGKKLFLQKEDVTLTPGVYVGGIFSGGVKRVVLRPGVYVMQDGDFFMSGAQVEGEGVTLFFTGARPGAFWTAAGTQLDLSAPTAGPLEGLLIVSQAQSGDNVRLTSTQGTLNGTIYAPRTGVSVSAGSDVSVPRVVCANIGLTLNSTLSITGTDVPAADAPATQ
jgi:hypothetical protein